MNKYEIQDILLNKGLVKLHEHMNNAENDISFKFVHLLRFLIARTDKWYEEAKYDGEMKHAERYYKINQTLREITK